MTVDLTGTRLVLTESMGYARVLFNRGQIREARFSFRSLEDGAVVEISAKQGIKHTAILTAEQAYDMAGSMWKAGALSIDIPDMGVATIYTDKNAMDLLADMLWSVVGEDEQEEIDGRTE